MRNYIALVAGKLTHLVTKLLSLGAGGTWPGEIALRIHPSFIAHQVSKIKEGIVIIAGTNGKTTTSLMLKTILESQNKKVVYNATGANLLNGIASSLIQSSSWSGEIEADWGVFETDENSLPGVLSEFKNQNSKIKVVIVLLNLFRDQLDRYGEVDVIAEKWAKSIKTLSEDSILVLNADDPLIAHLGFTHKKRLSKRTDHLKNTWFFGLNEPLKYLKAKEHATDSIFCLNCGARLVFEGIYYSHLGIWRCLSCGEKRPDPDVSVWKSPLPGLYNQYNTLAAVSVATYLNIKNDRIHKVLAHISPAFGRQEEFEVDGRRVKLFLSKNPTGFNQSIRTILELKAHHIVLVLNDRIPDGRDVSWIWDVDFEMLDHDLPIIVSGDRTHDLALRMKYTESKKLSIEPQLAKAIEKGIASMEEGTTLYVLATYSGMLDVRKLLIGRRIL